MLGVTLEPAAKAVIYQLARERHMSVASLGAELLLLGLTLQTGKSMNELISSNGGSASE